MKGDEQLHCLKAEGASLEGGSSPSLRSIQIQLGICLEGTFVQSGVTHEMSVPDELSGSFCPQEARVLGKTQ